MEEADIVIDTTDMRGVTVRFAEREWDVSDPIDLPATLRDILEEILYHTTSEYTVEVLTND